MMRLNRYSVRTRLTLWHAGTLALILLVFAGSIYFFVRAKLYKQVDMRLDHDIGLLAQTLRESPDETREIEAHNAVAAFRILEGDWPLYVSGGWANAELDDAMAQAHPSERWVWRAANDRHYHLKQTSLTIRDQAYAIAVGLDSEQIHRALNRLAIVLLVGSPLVVVASLLGGYFLATRALLPIQDMATKARAINADNLSQRLVIRNPDDELGHLGAVLNDTFGRLEQAFERLKRFTQDAAHELRTPLAVIRGVGEVGLQAPQTPDRYREIIGSMLEETDRLTRLVDGLLTLARADAGRVTLDRKPEYLAVLCREVADCLRVLAEDKQQTLAFTTAGTDTLTAVVDRDTLRLALINIVANAIRFTPARGAVRIGLNCRASDIVIEVADNGPGIAKEHQARLFERFYRVDRSRSHATGGTGLGLAIARWAVEANGGRIELDSDVGNGSRFRVVLPLA